MPHKNLGQFNKSLKINHPILGIHFLHQLPKNIKRYQDTACTALARVFFSKEILAFGAKKYYQLCPGGNYFLKLSDINDEVAADVYVNDEHIFKNRGVCHKFLKSLPKFPNHLKGKFILLKPLGKNDQPDVIVMLINPAQAGRIIGLLNYEKYDEIKIHPNQPTCLSFFSPLITNLPHLNFIDYYDRYYQGKIHGKYIWPENKMLISMKFKQFKKILDNLNKSPQGGYKRTGIKTQKVDYICYNCSN